MRVVFFGTPEPAAVALGALLGSRHQVAAVVTRPDRPRGRGRNPAPPPVKTLGAQHGIEVLQPAGPREEGFAAALRARTPDALAVVAYGHILPVDVLEVAPAVNVHFSLLPRYRGAAPVQRALMDGATETGVSVFRLERTLDTGPLLSREKLAIGPEETAGELLDRLASMGARLLVETLDAVEAGRATPAAQDDTEATQAPKVRPEETRVDWNRPAETIVNQVRALSPSPGAWTMFRGRRLNLYRARVAGETGAAAGAVGGAAPGEAVLLGKERIGVGAAGGTVELLEVQPEGKRRMPAADFARGYRPELAERLG